MSSFFLLITGYLLGSIPFGHIFSKMAGKNILEIGWRKTSASNVFKNVGFLPGFITTFGDLGKGFLAVYFAQKAGASLQLQALTGVAAVIGHNWSCFIRFAGGRGIATFIGALLFLSPKILALSLIPLFFFALFWNTSIGTIFFLFTTIILSWQAGELIEVGLLPLFSLGPILIKRLSPIKELSFRKKRIFLNRLLFDDDNPRFDLRISRMIRKLTKN